MVRNTSPPLPCGFGVSHISHDCTAGLFSKVQVLHAHGRGPWEAIVCVCEKMKLSNGIRQTCMGTKTHGVYYGVQRVYQPFTIKHDYPNPRSSLPNPDSNPRPSTNPTADHDMRLNHTGRKSTNPDPNFRPYSHGLYLQLYPQL